MRGTDIDHPLWTSGMPDVARPAEGYASDFQAVQIALGILQRNGVIVLGPLGECRRCGWHATYQRLCFGAICQEVTAVFWDEEDEFDAFSSNVRLSETDGIWRHYWQPALCLDLPLYWCGDWDLITQSLDAAELNFTTPRRCHLPFVVQPLSDAPIR